MKKLFLFISVTIISLMTYAECQDGPYGIQINGTEVIDAPAFGDKDAQGRAQYKAACVSLKVGDEIKLINQSCDATWMVDLDQYGEYQSFAGGSSAGKLTCNKAGKYDFYIKLSLKEGDLLYIGPGLDCSTPGYDGSAPAKYPGVMLQAFYWNSYQQKTDSSSIFGRTKWVDLKNNGQAAEIGKWFDLVWLPPSSQSSGGLGYHPVDYSNLDSDLGTKRNLEAIIDSLHRNGCRVVADVVVNHCDGSSSWCTFNPLDFGDYGQFQPTAEWICNTDEMNTSEEAGACKGEAKGGRDDGYDGEANYAASRDWDHNNAKVRDMVKAYLKYLRYTIGYDGFRYDYCKGFHMSHVNDYNSAARGHFSVIEYWDGNPSTLQSRLSDAGWNTLAFDFANYYTAIKGGIAGGDYGKCKGAGLPGQGKARYACTFADSHDTFQRGLDMGGDLAGYGSGESVKQAPDKVLACNAFILSMPGVPCVFFPHWVTFKDDIKKMINARYLTGVHSESSVSDEAGNGFYKATITGTNGEIRLLLGPNSGYGTTPSGYTLAAKGTNWGVYYKTNSARDDKDKNRTPIVKDQDPEFVTAIPSVESEASAPKAEKLLIDGRLYLRTIDGMIFDLTGRRQ